MEASEVIPPEEDKEEWYTEKGVSKDPTASTRMLDQEEKEDAQWTERRRTAGRTQDRLCYSCSAAGECAAEAIFCCPTENSHRLKS